MESLASANEYANSLSTDDKKAIVDNLKKQASGLTEEMDTAVDEQGVVSKAVGWVNNGLGIGTSEKKAKANITEYQKLVNDLDPEDPDFASKYKQITGEEFNEESVNGLLNEGQSKVSQAEENIYDYKETQEEAKDVAIGIAVSAAVTVSVVCAPLTGGASLALGAAVGGCAKLGLNALDAGTDKIEGNYSLAEGVMDFGTGAVEGLIDAATLGSAGMAGKFSKKAGEFALKRGAKQVASGAGKTFLKSVAHSASKSVPISLGATAGNYLMENVVKDKVYDITGEYTVAQSPSQISQNDDGSYSMYYEVTDSKSGDNLYYQIEKVDSLSQDENGNYLKGNVLETSRSNDFNAKDFGKQMLLSGGAALAGSTIGTFTGNTVNPFVSKTTGSKFLGQTAEIATDAALSLSADYGIACVSEGEVIDTNEFFSADRILGEGGNQLRGLIIGLASSKTNVSTSEIETTVTGMVQTGNIEGAKEYLGDYDLKSKDIEKIINSTSNKVDAAKTISDANLKVLEGDTKGAENLLKEDGYGFLERKNLLYDAKKSSKTSNKVKDMATSGDIIDDNVKNTSNETDLDNVKVKSNETDDTKRTNDTKTETDSSVKNENETVKNTSDEVDAETTKSNETDDTKRTNDAKAKTDSSSEAVKKQKIIEDFFGENNLDPDSGGNVKITSAAESFEKICESDNELSKEIDKKGEAFKKAIESSTLLKEMNIESRNRNGETTRKIDLPNGESVTIKTPEDLIKVYEETIKIEESNKKYVDSEYKKIDKIDSELKDKIDNIELPDASENEYVKKFWGEDVTIDDETKKILSIMVDKTADLDVDWNADSNVSGMTNLQLMTSMAKYMQVKGSSETYLSNPKMLKLQVSQMLSYSDSDISSMYPYKNNSNTYNELIQNWDEYKVAKSAAWDDNIKNAKNPSEAVVNKINKDRDYVNQLTDVISKHKISLDDDMYLYKGEQINGTLNYCLDKIQVANQDGTTREVPTGDYCLEILKRSDLTTEQKNKMIENVLIEKTVYNERFDSTTMNKDLAVNWAQGNRINGGADNGGVAVVWKISASDETHGILNECANSRSNGYYDQYEVLLQRGGTKTITGVDIQVDEATGKTTLVIEADYSESSSMTPKEHVADSINQDNMKTILEKINSEIPDNIKEQFGTDELPNAESITNAEDLINLFYNAKYQYVDKNGQTRNYYLDKIEENKSFINKNPIFNNKEKTKNTIDE